MISDALTTLRSKPPPSHQAEERFSWGLKWAWKKQQQQQQQQRGVNFTPILFLYPCPWNCGVILHWWVEHWLPLLSNGPRQLPFTQPKLLNKLLLQTMPPPLPGPLNRFEQVWLLVKRAWLQCGMIRVCACLSLCFRQVTMTTMISRTCLFTYNHHSWRMLLLRIFAQLRRMDTRHFSLVAPSRRKRTYPSL